MFKKIIFTVVFLIGLAILARLLAPSWYHFLAVNKPLEDADILLVEGWVSESTLQNAALTFNEGNYAQIVVASILLESEFNLHSSGALVYNIGKMEDIKPPFHALNIKAYSSIASGEYAKMMVVVDKDTLGEVLTSDQIKTYSFPINIVEKAIQQIKIIYTNDHFDNLSRQDRNLYIHSLEMDHTLVPTRSPHVYYDRGKIDGQKIEKIYKSRAGYSAEYLIELGVPPQAIHTIDAPRVEYNKTYTTAIEVGKWLGQHLEKQHRVNLISENVHSRRSWMLFKKEMPQNVEIGIIASSRFNNDANKWWKNSGRKAYVISQSMKYWYAVLTYYLI